MASYTKKIISSGAVQVASGSGVIDLSASSHVSANELQLTTPLAMSRRSGCKLCECWGC